MSTPATLALGNVSGQPGTTVHVPVTLDLGDQQADRAAFAVQASELTISGFEVAAGLAAPTVLPRSDGSLSVAWLSLLETPLTGPVGLGNLVMTIPANAAAGQTWNVQATAVGASLGEEEVPSQAGAGGLVTALAPTPHDVAVKRFTAPAKAKVGDNPKLTLEVQNLTATAESVTVRLLRNGAVVQSWPVNLAGRATSRLTAKYQFVAADTPSVELKAEVVLPGDQHPENNAAAVTVKVK
jgi:hypothetical protein